MNGFKASPPPSTPWRGGSRIRPPEPRHRRRPRVPPAAYSLAGAHGHIGTEPPYCIVDDPARFENLQVSYQCGAAKSFFAVDPSGYVKVCNHSEHRLCKVWDVDSLEVDAYWQTFVNGDYLPAMCDGCAFADSCDGGCREAANVCRGSVAAPDPLFVT